MLITRGFGNYGTGTGEDIYIPVSTPDIVSNDTVNANISSKQALPSMGSSASSLSPIPNTESKVTTVRPSSKEYKPILKPTGNLPQF